LRGMAFMLFALLWLNAECMGVSEQGVK
jgi:hypothetical protein